MIATFKLYFNFKSFNKLTIQFENMIWFQPIQPIGCISITDRYLYIYILSPVCLLLKLDMCVHNVHKQTLFIIHTLRPL